VKLTLPDAHADFIFAVAGEETGLIATLLLVSMFCFIILRSIVRIRNTDDMFIIWARRAADAICVAKPHSYGVILQLLPAKGMTLPFISYGGSSLLSLGLGMGHAAGTHPETRGFHADDQLEDMGAQGLRRHRDG